MKRSELKQLIKEVILEAATTKKTTAQSVLTNLFKTVKSVLADNNVKIKKLTFKDIEYIAYVWLDATIDSGYINSETLGEDIYENDEIYALLKSKKAYDYGDDDND